MYVHPSTHYKPITHKPFSFIKLTLLGTSSIESWFIKGLVFSPFGGWDAEEWYYF